MEKDDVVFPWRYHPLKKGKRKKKMKKLMIVACAIALASVAQAASVSWGGAIADPSYSTTGAASAAPVNAYLLWAATDLGTSTSFDTATGISNTGFMMVDSYTVTSADANNGWSFAKEYTNAGKDVNGYYQVLVTNAEGDKASIYEFNITGTTPTSTTQDMKLNALWTDPNTFLQQGGYTVAVPEPTSGLLMLVGLAGLALRRRRA
jgi:hypothetical protein